MKEPHPTDINITPIIADRNPLGAILLRWQSRDAARSTSGGGTLAELLPAREAAGSVAADVRDAVVAVAGAAVAVWVAEGRGAAPVVLAALGGWMEVC